MDEERQEQFKLHQAISSGEDENGAYDVVPLSMVKGGKLKPTKVYRKPVKHVITTSSPSPRGWYKNKWVADRVRPRPCYTESVLTVPFSGACIIGCKYCYVAHGTRGYRATGIATVTPNYPDQMRKALSKMMIAAPAYITSFTEPFQPLEDRYHITQRLSQVFIDEGLPLFYLTRLIPPEWAVEAILKNPYSYMQWSINTPNERHRRMMSPGTAKLDDVWAAMERLSDLGIFISVQVNPILAGITTLDELVELVNLIADHGGHHVIFKFAEQVYSNRKLLLERLSKLPNVDKFDKLLNQTIGGVYTIQQDVRLEWLNVLLEETRNIGITMSTCYEYYDNGKAGANYAPYVSTSDNCHGRGIPIFYRPEVGAKFRPLPGCSKIGCLYCAEYGTRACGNETLLQAKALEFKDYKSIKLVGDERNWDLPGSCLRPDVITSMDGVNPGFKTHAELWDWEQVS